MSRRLLIPSGPQSMTLGHICPVRASRPDEEEIRLHMVVREALPVQEEDGTWWTSTEPTGEYVLMVTRGTASWVYGLPRDQSRLIADLATMLWQSTVQDWLAEWIKEEGFCPDPPVGQEKD